MTKPLTTFIAATVCALSAVNGVEAASRPNVVLIITDDQGYGDLGHTGNHVIMTPKLDALAQSSARLTNFYVSPVCAPTRACLMTGRYNYRTRVVDTFKGRAMMEPREVTVAEILRSAGYETGIFGKWHLGDNHPMRPQDQGFDEDLVHRGGGIGQNSDPRMPDERGNYTDPILFHNGTQKQVRGYCTDVYFDGALKWIEDCQSRRRSFFAYIATNAPHGPFYDVPDALYQKYKSRDLKPVSLGGNDDLDRLARVFAMVTNIDENVGKLLQKLDALKLADDTIVIFMVDNGPNTRRFVGSMRGRKTEVHQGGIRSPFFVRWPGRLEAGDASDRVAAHIDVLPTVLEACGVAIPAGLKVDGRSLLPLLERRRVDWADRTIFIQSHRGAEPVRYNHFAAVGQRWKLVHPTGFSTETFAGRPKLQLYDLANDPREQYDLSAQHPQLVERLRRAYDMWFDDVSATRANNFAPPRIHLGTPHENPVVLTRQDWQPTTRNGSDGPDANGFWRVRIDRPGTFEVLGRFYKLDQPAKLKLTIGETGQGGSAAAGSTSHSFQAVDVAAGDVDLGIEIKLPDARHGPWQIDVRRLK